MVQRLSREQVLVRVMDDAFADRRFDGRGFANVWAGMSPQSQSILVDHILEYAKVIATGAEFKEIVYGFEQILTRLHKENK